MSELIAATRSAIERDERIHFIVLSAFTAVLAVAFMVLLISDQVAASAL